MKSCYKNLTKDLQKVSQQMRLDGLSFGVVGHIGGSPKEIGKFFAEHFGCELCHLPSINREKRNRTLTTVINKIYPFLPEQILRVIANKYKQLYQSSERIFPNDFEFNSLCKENKHLSILLVDDNSLTGKTFEIWKEKIKENTGRSSYTFSITKTGSYEPDYYCYKEWHSFKWRPIGI